MVIRRRAKGYFYVLLGLAYRGLFDMQMPLFMVKCLRSIFNCSGTRNTPLQNPISDTFHWCITLKTFFKYESVNIENFLDFSVKPLTNQIRVQAKIVGSAESFADYAKSSSVKKGSKSGRRYCWSQIAESCWRISANQCFSSSFEVEHVRHLWHYPLGKTKA